MRIGFPAVGKEPLVFFVFAYLSSSRLAAPKVVVGILVLIILFYNIYIFVMLYYICVLIKFIFIFS